MSAWSNFLTPARVLTAVGVAATSVGISVQGAHGPAWVGILFAAIAGFCGTAVAFTGPVQQNAEDNKVAKAAVAENKAAQ